MGNEDYAGDGCGMQCRGQGVDQAFGPGKLVGRNVGGCGVANKWTGARDRAERGLGGHVGALTCTALGAVQPTVIPLVLHGLVEKLHIGIGRMVCLHTVPGSHVS